MASFTQFLGSLDADAGKRGKQFEHFVKWFLKNDPQWSTQVDEIWLWEEWPQRWGPDCGIDLVFKHKDGQTWAVQSKCYDAKYNITKHDVDKFLSESNRAGIDKRLLIATTDGLGANAKQVCDAQDKEVVRYLLSHFEDADIDYPNSLADLNKAKPKPKPLPKPHQVEAIEAVTKGFTDTDRGQLIMACGTGKTFTTLWIKESLNSESTLILLPSLGLLSQTLHEWTGAKSKDFAVLCVCSDDSVGKKGGDEAVHDIADLAFPVTSDPVEIAKFLNQVGPKVIFSTYQSSNLIADAQADQKVPAFNLAIADEAHRCAGDKAGNFATILDGQRIRADKRLFTTATPRTYSTALKKGAEGRGIEIVGMDNEAVFGKHLYTLNFGEAIKRGLLTDYRVVIVGVDSPMIASYIENREFVKTETGLEKDAETLAAQVALLKAMKDFDLHRMISFHSRVNRAEGFAKDLTEVANWVDAKHRPSGELMTDFVSGEMPTFARRQKLTMLKNTRDNERSLLTNARCLSEGVDVPSLDGVAFIDPRASQVDIIQAVGRAIRLSPNKKAGTIVLPVFIGHGDNPEQALDEGNFKPIWDVLNALKSHDDVLADELDQMRVGMGKRGSSKVQGGFSKIEVDLPASVDKSFSDSIQTRLVESTTASWEYWLGLLQSYKRENGNVDVPLRYVTPSGENLGNWCGNQKKLYLNHKLGVDRSVRLESIEGWTWQILDRQWTIAYEKLKLYFKDVGEKLVPVKYVDSSGFKLGAWVAQQRTAFSQGRLDQNRKNMLEELPSWTWDVLDSEWHKGYLHLTNYLKEHGDARPPSTFITPSGFRLGSWLQTLRDKKKAGSLRNEYFELLNSLSGIQWDVLSEAWDEAYQCLKSYADEYGNAQVPTRYVTSNGFKLGFWVGVQRRRKASGVMSLDRIIRLEGLAGWQWDPATEQWQAGFEEFKSYITEYRNPDVPQRYVTKSGFRLGWWIGTQRISKANGILTNDKICALESIVGWKWDVLDTQWEEKFLELKKYVEKNGTSLIPAKYITPSGVKLGMWVNNQRASYIANKISQDRISKLENLSGWQWSVLESQWENGFSELSLYVQKNGNAQVLYNYRTDSGFGLGSWVVVQRRNYSKGILTSQQTELLNGLDGWVWDAFEDKWEQGFVHLKEYVAEFGHCKIPKRYLSPDKYTLGSWVLYQRMGFAQKKILRERILKLESVTDWFW